MASKRLQIGVTDNGQTLSIVVERYESVGDVVIGPIPVASFQTLAFPVEDVEQWQRDVVVQVLERL